MEIKISMRTRDDKAYAEGIYTPEKTVVKAGGKVSEQFRGSKQVRYFRESKDFVDEEGNILKDCEFSSPSYAAQFVNGNISNGLRVWKVKGVSLGSYLQKLGN